MRSALAETSEITEIGQDSQSFPIDDELVIEMETIERMRNTICGLENAEVFPSDQQIKRHSRYIKEREEAAREKCIERYERSLRKRALLACGMSNAEIATLELRNVFEDDLLDPMEKPLFPDFFTEYQEEELPLKEAIRRPTVIKKRLDPKRAKAFRSADGSNNKKRNWHIGSLRKRRFRSEETTQGIMNRETTIGEEMQKSKIRGGKGHRTPDHIAKARQKTRVFKTHEGETIPAGRKGQAFSAADRLKDTGQLTPALERIWGEFGTETAENISQRGTRGTIQGQTEHIRRRLLSLQKTPESGQFAKRVQAIEIIRDQEGNPSIVLEGLRYWLNRILYVRKGGFNKTKAARRRREARLS